VHNHLFYLMLQCIDYLVTVVGTFAFNWYNIN